MTYFLVYKWTHIYKNNLKKEWTPEQLAMCWIFLLTAY